MKCWWNGGVEGKAIPLLRECWTFFDLHFPTPAVEAMSRICACKTERNLQIFGWCLQFKQSCPWATLSYFSLKNKSGKINATRGVALRKCIKRAQSYLFALKCEEVLLQIEFTTFAAKKPRPLCEVWNKKGIGEKELRPQANDAKRGGGVAWEESGRGGGRLPYTNLLMSQVK